MTIGEQAFWLAAERYETSPHTIKDVWAAWDLVVDYTNDIEERIKARDLLNKQYYGFKHTIDARELYHAPGALPSRQCHPDWLTTDYEKFNSEIYGCAAHVRNSV